MRVYKSGPPNLIIFAARYATNSFLSMLFRLTSLFFAVLLLLSCNNSSHCYESSETLLVTTFTGGSTLKIDSILVKGAAKTGIGDTLKFSRDSALTISAGLPLSLSADSTGFVVFANGRTSSFWLKHTMNLKLISQSCGFAPNYKLVATRHSSLIDSVSVSDPIVDPQSVERYATNGQNITIYLHLATP